MVDWDEAQLSNALRANLPALIAPRSIGHAKQDQQSKTVEATPVSGFVAFLPPASEADWILADFPVTLPESPHFLRSAMKPSPRKATRGMKALRAILISSALPAIAILSGCGEEGGGKSEAQTKAPPTTESGGYPKFVREWIGANGLEQSDEAASIADNPGTRKLIEERFREMDWGNDQAKASFTIELDAERSLEFRSESGASNDQRNFSAIWTRPGPTIGGATSAIVKRSRPIPGADKALEMLNRFIANDGDMQSIAEWEE